MKPRSRFRALFAIAALGALLAFPASACGSADDANSDRSGAPPAETREVRSPVPPGVTPIQTAVSPDEPVSSTPGGDGGGAASASPVPRPTPTFNTKSEPAPIDGAELIIRESFPPQYALRLVSGIPSGCHQYEATTVERNGTDFAVTVTNIAPNDSGIACTAIYGQHEQTVNLGSDLISGTVYTVTINGDPATAITFTAQ